MLKKLFLLFVSVILVLGLSACAAECSHADKNDDRKCDLCDKGYTDGCDLHRDIYDDDGKCDVCGAEFSDGCDLHRDADDNEHCDICDAEFSDGYDHMLNKKKVIFIGNSYTYYGRTVMEKSQSYLLQESRKNDKGYFYQLCSANGAEVEVTNWTFGGHNLANLFDGNCTADRGCDGEDHKAYLTDRYYDYVVIQPGSGASSSASFLSDMETVMSFFREANPNVKFVVLVPYSAYGTIGSTINLATEFLGGLKTVAEMGVSVVDWGGVVMDLLNGVTSVPNSSFEYTKNTFVISKSAKDGYHPNQLSGYITTLMVYAAITGEAALGQTYDFCLNPSTKSLKFENFVAKYYTYNGATTNYPEIFASETEMAGIQTLIDAHLEKKAYMSYSFTKPEAE